MPSATPIVVSARMPVYEMPDSTAIFNIEKYKPQLLPRKISSKIGRGPDVNRMSFIEPQ